MMRKLQEFEMFKRLMLDKQQEKLFSSLPKPNLANLDFTALKPGDPKSNQASQKSGSVASLEDEKEDEELVHELEVKNAYEDLKKRGRESEVTKKLLKAFEDSILRDKLKARSRTMGVIGREDEEEEGLRKRK